MEARRCEPRNSRPEGGRESIGFINEELGRNAKSKK